MKKSIAGSLVIFTASMAHAQNANVTVYGLVDTGVEYLTNVGTAGRSLTRMPSLTGTLPSRIGLRGTEDLGGGLKAVFALENGFALDSGAPGQGARLFGRQAFAGLAGSLGTVALGRQYTMLYWALLDSDILGPNIYGSSSLDSYLPNARADNAISYRGAFGGLMLGASYSLGRDTVNGGPSPSGANCRGEKPGNSKTCREWSMLVKFDTGQWGLAAAQDRINGGPGAFAGLNGDLKDSRGTLNGYMKFNQAKVGAGMLYRNNGASATPKSNLYYAEIAYPLTPALTLDGAVMKLDTRNSPSDAILMALRATYLLSKRTSAYVTTGHIANDGGLALSVSTGAAGGYPVPGASQAGVMVGMRHFF